MAAGCRGCERTSGSGCRQRHCRHRSICHVIATSNVRVKQRPSAQGFRSYCSTRTQTLSPIYFTYCRRNGLQDIRPRPLCRRNRKLAESPSSSPRRPNLHIGAHFAITSYREIAISISERPFPNLLCAQPHWVVPRLRVRAWQAWQWQPAGPATAQPSSPALPRNTPLAGHHSPPDWTQPGQPRTAGSSQLTLPSTRYADKHAISPFLHCILASR